MVIMEANCCCCGRRLSWFITESIKNICIKSDFLYISNIEFFDLINKRTDRPTDAVGGLLTAVDVYAWSCWLDISRCCCCRCSWKLENICPYLSALKLMPYWWVVRRLLWRQGINISLDWTGQHMWPVPVVVASFFPQFNIMKSIILHISIMFRSNLF